MLQVMFKFIKENKRYLAVGIIFLVVFLWGGNLGIKPNEDLVTHGKVAKEIITLDQNHNFFLKEGFINARKGDNYRLMFNVSANEDCKLIVKIVSPFGSEDWVQALNLEKSSNYENKEIVFNPPGYFSDLVFEREDHKDDVSIAIRDLKISRLMVDKESDVATLKKTIVGNTTDILVPSQDEGKEVGFSALKEGKEALGQVFKAQQPYFGGVVFKGRKIGNGGVGKYRLELYKVKEKNGNFFIDGNIISFSNFSAEDLSGYLNGEGELILPVAATLKEGESYFICLSNISAKTNGRNYWELQGTGNDLYSDGSVATLKAGSLKKENGDLYFKIISKKYTEEGGEKVLTGAVEEDLGGGLGKYSYQNNGEVTDFLDLYSYSSASGNGNNPAVRYNEYERTISATSTGDTNYVYKINTIYPFEKIKLSAEQMYSMWCKVKLFYSFNNKDWTEIPYEYGDESPQIFNEVIEGDETAKELYVKVTYDKEDDEAIQLFGLRYLSVVASLKL